MRRVAGAGTGSCSDAAGAEIRVAAQDSSSISHVTVSEYKYVEIQDVARLVFSYLCSHLPHYFGVSVCLQLYSIVGARVSYSECCSSLYQIKTRR